MNEKTRAGAPKPYFLNYEALHELSLYKEILLYRNTRNKHNVNAIVKAIS